MRNPHEDQRNDMEVLDESDAEAAEGATPEQIAAILRLARQQFRLMRRLDAVAGVLKRAQGRLTANQMVLLPKAMLEAKLDECPLGERGAKVEMNTILKASIPNVNNKKVEKAAERNATGIAYMDLRAPDMVDTVLTIRFPKGTEKDLRRFQGDNKRRKVPLEMELNRTVNTGSLQAWIIRELEAGRSVDEEALNVHRVRIAEVVLPKVKKLKKEEVL